MTQTVKDYTHLSVALRVLGIRTHVGNPSVVNQKDSFKRILWAPPHQATQHRTTTGTKKIFNIGTRYKRH